MENANPITKKPVQRWQVILLVGVAVVALVLGVAQVISKGEPNNAEPILHLGEPVCTASGGAWNSCGSLCRGVDIEFCAQVCVGQCECTTSEQCPFGYECGEFIESNGICVKSI